MKLWSCNAEGERMKRVYSIVIGIFSVFVLTAFVGYSNQNTYNGEKAVPEKGEVFISYEEVKIYPWKTEGNLYFFLPSAFDWEQAELTVLNGDFLINGKSVDFSAEAGRQSYDMDTNYTYQFAWGDVEEEGTLIFMQSANIGTVYIETETGSMDQVDRDKEYRESGLALVKDADGKACYRGFLDSIKSRGNATWNSEKKSYTIKLSKPADLFQMGEGKNWILLSNVYDGTKLRNKICLDMAAELGLPYTSQGEWIDLYINGQYRGNYLLCEKIEINENRVEITDLEKQTKKLNGELQQLETFDTETRKGVLAVQNPENITGGYIIEKDYYADSISSFWTENENLFSIRAPQYATREQVDYIADYTQQIEDLIVSGSEDLFDYIDLDSFVMRYLLDETVLNFDFGITSMYFYKERDDQKLYAGPIWDYDISMGAGTFTDSKTMAALQIEDSRRVKRITWSPYLYKNDIFYNEIVETYHERVRPYILNLIEENGKIDFYVDTIEASIKMDMIRWPCSQYSQYSVGYYESFENNVRYIKYFLARRLRFLDKEWLGEDNRYEPEGNGKLHTATFIGKTKTESFEVLDGEVIIGTPEFLLGEREWWFNVRDERIFVVDIPVYEDVTYYARKGEWEID